jgi:hypothetical protein
LSRFPNLKFLAANNTQTRRNFSLMHTNDPGDTSARIDLHRLHDVYGETEQRNYLPAPSIMCAGCYIMTMMTSSTAPQVAMRATKGSRLLSDGSCRRFSSSSAKEWCQVPGFHAPEMCASC